MAAIGVRLGQIVVGAGPGAVGFGAQPEDGDVVRVICKEGVVAADTGVEVVFEAYGLGAVLEGDGVSGSVAGWGLGLDIFWVV